VVRSRFGRYEVLQAIASGGMATVHLARAVGAGGFERLVAIKSMHAGFADDPQFVAMFLDEARVAARIRHPNVVGTIDVEQDDEGLFLVMEFVEGPSLSAMIRAVHHRKERLPQGVALRILLDALMGLHAAHEQTGPSGEPLHIVHRDVSPHNILVGLDGLSKITDFGVAQAEARLSSTRGGEVKGKLAYMSPQQVCAEPIDRRADVYAAGVVLWELLAGQRLFVGNNDGALVKQVLAGPSGSPRARCDDVPASIDRECMRALSLATEDRHPTALAFAEALELAAEEAKLAIATPRAVAAYAKALGAHKPLAIPPLQTSVTPLSRAAARQGPSAGAERAEQADLSQLASVSAAPGTESQVSSLVSAVEPARPQSSRARLAAAAALSLGIGALGAVLVVRYLGAGPGAGAAPSAADDPSKTAAQDAGAPVVSVAPGPTAGPAQSAATSAPPSAPPAAPSATSPTKPSVAPAKPPVVKGPAKPRSNGDDWRPQGL
jgi:serine/threonine-protein kinase